MAIIYSYPLSTPKVKDLLIGTSVFDENDENSPRNNPTVSFTIQSLVDMIAPGIGGQNLQQVTNIGSTTTNSITIANGLSVTGTFTDSSGGVGQAGQILSSTNIGTSWIANTAQGVTSVGLTMPAAFTVANSPITTAGTFTVTGAGAANQYINGLGALTLFPAIPGAYVLPLATTVARGGVKIGYTENAKNYPVELLNEQMFVNVPWTDTSYTLPAATNLALGGIKIGYTDNAKNYALELDADSEAYVNVPWTDTTYTLPLAADGTRGGVQIGYTQTATRDYPVTLDSEKMLVTVPWTDTQNAFQTITGTGSGNTDSGILLSDGGGTVKILGDGTVISAAQTGNTITLTGVNTWVANAVTVAGYVAAPAATDVNLVWKTNGSGEPAWRADADTDTGVTGVTLAINSTGTWTVPLSESITGRELTLTSNVYGGGAKVGYVPTGGTSSLYLKGDGTWAAVPTGLQFQGTWDASATGGGNPDLDVAANQGDGFLWITNVAGSATPNGAGTTPNSWAVGDWAVYSGTAGSGTWTKVPATNTGVTSLTTTDGTWIDLTPTTATTGAVTVTADLSAQDGSSDTSTKFLSKDNTWDVPSYTTNTDETYDLNAGAKVGTSVPINLTSTSGTDNSLVNLKEGTNITLTRGSATEITIDATDTNTNTTYDFLAIETIPTFTLNTPTTNTGYTTAVNLATTVSPTGGTGMTVDITASAGNVTAVVINKPGSGYAIGDAVTVVQTGSSANAIITLSGATGNVNPNLRLIDNAFAFEDVKLTGAGATTITRTSDTGITITSTDTNTQYTAGNGLNLSGTVFSADVNNTQANDDTVTLSATADRFYAVQLDNNVTIANADLVVNVPWTDTDTDTTYDLENTSGGNTGQISLVIGDVIATAKANGASSGNTITYDTEVPTNGIVNGQIVRGTGIPAGCRIVSHTATSLVITGTVTVANNAVLSFHQADTINLVGGDNTTVGGFNGDIRITSADTEYTAGRGITLNTLEFDVNVDATASAEPEGLSTTANQTYKVQLDDQSENLVVNVPWSSGGTYSWTVKDNTATTPITKTLATTEILQFVMASHNAAPTATLTDTAGASPYIMTLTGRDTTYSTVSTSAAGLAPILPSAVGGKFLKADATWAVPDYVTYSDFTVSTASAPGTAGLVPAPATGTQGGTYYLNGNKSFSVPPDTTYDVMGAGNSYAAGLVLAGNATSGGAFLRKDGTWQVPPGDGNTTYTIGVTAPGSDNTNVTITPSSGSSSTIQLTAGTYIKTTPAAASAQTTLDLSAVDGFDGFGTRYLSKDNTWDVPRTTNIEVIVTVVAVSGQGNRYFLNGVQQADYTLMSGFTYQFNQEALNNVGHPFAFSTNANNSPAAPYTTGVSTSNTPGTTSSYTQIQVGPSTPNLYYYCTQHLNMGGSAPREASFISLTHTGTSGASTLTNGILNVPNYTVGNDNDYLTGLAFDTGDGVLTATVQNQSDVTVDLDGRYLTSASNYYLDGITKTGNVLTFSVSGTTNQTYTFGANAFNSTTIPTNNNQLTNGAGYITSESDTLLSVTGRGASTSVATNFTGSLTVNGSGAGAYFYVSGNAQGTAPPTTYNTGLAMAWNNSGGSRENEIYFATGSGATQAENDSTYFSFINRFNAAGTPVDTRVAKFYGNGDVDFLGKVFTNADVLAGSTKIIDFATSSVAGDATGFIGNYFTTHGAFANPTTTAATFYDQSGVGPTLSGYRVAIRNYDGTNMLASATFTDTSLTVVGDVIAYGSPSDIRLKENIKPIESALDKVSKLQGVTFDWKKSDSILDIKKDIGFIAQDVQEVIPELVRENKDGMLSMRHQGIAPILLEAIKELKDEIEELKLSKCNCK